jgi:hypothetical protein
MKPIGLFGFAAGARTMFSMSESCPDTRLSNSSSFLVNSLLAAASCLRRTNARMIAMLTAIARALRSTDESIATPCSEKAYGSLRRPPHCRGSRKLEITVCDFKFATSCFVS